MIYRRGEGVACLNFEVARMAADIYNRGSDLDQVDVQKFLFNLLGVDVEPEINIEKLEEGISFDVVESETRRAMIMVEASKLVSIIFLDDPFLSESISGTLKAGVQNLSFFRFSEGAENVVKTAAKIVKTFRARKRK